MRKRKLLVVLVGLAVVVASGVFALCVTTEPTGGALRANFHRIATNGVSSQSELVSILGPPGDYTTGPTEVLPGRAPVAPVPKQYLLGLSANYWKTDTAEVTTEGEMDGDAMLACWTVTRSPQGPLDNLLWRAKRRWRRWFP